MSARLGYRLTEIGEIPEKWEILRLGEVLELCDSGTWGAGEGVPPEGFGILRSTNIQAGKILLDEVAFRIVPSNKVDKYRLSPGDILVTRSSGSSQLVGELAYFDLPDDRVFLFSNYTQRLRSNSLIHPKFLFYYLSSSAARAILTRIFDTTTGLKNLNMKTYKKQPIPLPLIREQERIASILSTVDDAIQKTEEIIAKTQQLKKGLMQQLLTRGIGHTKFKQTDIGEIPEEWQVKPIAEISNKPEYGYTQSASEKPVGPKFLRITDITDDGVNWNEVPFCECPESIVSDYLLRPGDILFARTGATTGKSFLVRSCPRAVFASYLIRLRVKQTADAEYLFQFFNSMLYWRQIRQNMVGSAQGGINATLLSRIRVPLGSIDEQQRTASILSGVDEKIAKERQRRDALEHLKKGLMQVLLAGKVRVEVD